MTFIQSSYNNKKNVSLSNNRDDQNMTLIDDNHQYKHYNDHHSLKKRLKDQLFHLQSQISNKFLLKFNEETLNEIVSFYSGAISSNSLNNDTDYSNINSKIFEEIIQLQQKYNLVDPQPQHKKDDDNCEDNFLSNVSMMDIGGDYESNDRNTIDYDSADGNGIQTKSNTVVQVSSNNDNIGDTLIPCYHYWQFWFWKSDQRFFKWDYGLQKLAKPFCKLEKLIYLFEQELLPINDLVIPSDYSIFREMIRPKWEDSSNRDGGCWIIEFDRNEIDSKFVQTIWEQLAEYLIQNHCQQKCLEHVCGLKISMRFKQYIISVWTDRFYDLSNILDIGIEMQKLIDNVIINKYNPNDDDENDDQNVKIKKPLMIYLAHKIAQKNAIIKERAKYGYSNNGSRGGVFGFENLI